MNIISKQHLRKLLPPEEGALQEEEEEISFICMGSVSYICSIFLWHGGDGLMKMKSERVLEVY